MRNKLNNTGCSKRITAPPPADKPSVQNPDNKPQINPGENEGLKTDTGRYVGQIDSNFIEIKISGVPEELAAKSFMLSEELKNNFGSLNLNTGDNIKFKFKMNTDNQVVIYEIEKS